MLKGQNITFKAGKSFNRGSYMSAHVLLNLLNELWKREFRNEFNKFNNTGVRMLDFIYHMTLTLSLLKKR